LLASLSAKSVIIVIIAGYRYIVGYRYIAGGRCGPLRRCYRCYRHHVIAGRCYQLARYRAKHRCYRYRYIAGYRWLLSAAIAISRYIATAAGYRVICHIGYIVIGYCWRSLHAGYRFHYDTAAISRCARRHIIVNNNVTSLSLLSPVIAATPLSPHRRYRCYRRLSLPSLPSLHRCIAGRYIAGYRHISLHRHIATAVLSPHRRRFAGYRRWRSCWFIVIIAGYRWHQLAIGAVIAGHRHIVAIVITTHRWLSATSPHRRWLPLVIGATSLAIAGIAGYRCYRYRRHRYIAAIAYRWLSLAIDAISAGVVMSVMHEKLLHRAISVTSPHRHYRYIVGIVTSLAIIYRYYRYICHIAGYRWHRLSVKYFPLHRYRWRLSLLSLCTVTVIAAIAGYRRWFTFVLLSLLSATSLVIGRVIVIAGIAFGYRYIGAGGRYIGYIGLHRYHAAIAGYRSLHRLATVIVIIAGYRCISLTLAISSRSPQHRRCWLFLRVIIVIGYISVTLPYRWLSLAVGVGYRYTSLATAAIVIVTSLHRCYRWLSRHIGYRCYRCYRHIGWRFAYRWLSGYR
jgi:hypothetical protein